MCQFLPSEVARLVLGYLEDTKCHKSYRIFLSESPDLEECRRIVGKNVKYGRGKETLLSILQDYCDLTSNANAASQLVEHHPSVPIPADVEHHSAPTSEKPADTDSVFKTPDKNNYRSLRKHVLRQRNLTKQFLSSPIRHHQAVNNNSRADDSLENRSSSDPPPTNSQSLVATVDINNQSSKRSEAIESSVLSSKESHSVEQIVSTRQFFFDAENRKGTIKAVYLHSPVRKDIYGRKTIAVTSKRLNFSPSSSSRGIGSVYDDSSQACGDETTQIIGKQIHFRENTLAINKTPLKDCSNKNPCSITSNKSSDEVDRCKTVEEEEIISDQIPDPKLPHISVSSPCTQTTNNSLSVTTRVQIMGTPSVTLGWCTPEVTAVTSTPIVSSEVVNKNILSPTMQITSTPEYNSNPPFYSTCPSSVNSPRYVLSDERLSQVAMLTPNKNFHDLRYEDGKSPKRKSIIPRRRVVSEHPSPGPKQHTLTDFMNFNNLSVDSGTDPLATFEEWFNFSALAETLADTINKVKNSEESVDSAAIELANSNKSDNDLVSQGKNDKLIHEIVKHTDDALEELVLCFSDKLEHSSRDHASNSFPNNLLLSPNTFVSHGQSYDTQRNQMPTDRMICTLNDGCSEKMDILNQNLSHNSHGTPIAKASVIETTVVESSVIGTQISGTSAIETSIVETSVIQSPSVHASDALCADETVIKNADSDLIQNQLTVSKPNESTSSVLIDLPLDSTGTSATQAAPKVNLQKKGSPQRDKDERQVGDILNQAMMETINYESPSKKKDLSQTMPISTPQVSYAFPGNSDTVQSNNSAPLIYPIPNIKPVLPGIQGNPQTYIIVYPNSVPNVGNASISIPPTAQQVPLVCSGTTNQIATSTPVKFALTKRKRNSNNRRPIRKNLFDPPTPNNNLPFHAKTTQDKLKLINPNFVKMPNVKIQDVLSNNKDLIGSDHIPVLSIPSPSVSPFHCEKNSSFLYVSSTNVPNPRTVIVSQPVLSKITQGTTIQLNDKHDTVQVDGTTTENANQTNYQETSSANGDLTPVEINISMENSPFNLFTLSPSHVRGLQQGYFGGSRLPVILPKVPGLDLNKSRENKRVPRKRKCTSNTGDVNEPKSKRGRPAARPRLKKKGLFNPVHVSKSPTVQNQKETECEVSEDSRSPRNFFAEMMGWDRRILQTPIKSQPAESLSSASKATGSNNHTRTSHIRALNFSPEAIESERISPKAKQIVTRNKDKKRLSSLKNVSHRKKKPTKCKKKNAKNKASHMSNIGVDPTDSDSIEYSDINEPYSAEEDLPKSAKIVVKTPVKVPISNKNEWNRISVDDSFLERIGSVDIVSPVKQNILSRPQTRATCSLLPVQSTKQTRKLSSSNESSDMDDSKVTINIPSENKEMANLGKTEEIVCIADEVERDGLLNNRNCKVKLSKLHQLNKVHPLPGTAQVTEKTSPMQGDTNSIVTVKEDTQTKKVKAMDPKLSVGINVPKVCRNFNNTSNSSSIPSQTFEKKKNRSKSSPKISPLQPGKAAVIQSLNVLTSVALTERLKKKSMDKPVVPNFPSNAPEKTITQCSANEYDKNLDLENGDKSFGFVNCNPVTIKLNGEIPSIITELSAENEIRCSPNSTYADVESEVLISCGTQSPSSIQTHQDEQCNNLPSENTMELEEAITSITSKADGEDEENNIENVETLTKQIRNGLADEGSILKTPRKGHTPNKNSFLNAVRIPHSENTMEINEAVNSIAPKVASDDELEKLKAFLCEEPGSDSPVENNSISKLPKPTNSYDECSIPITPGKSLINVAVSENSNLKDPVTIPAEKAIVKKGINSQKLTTKRSDFEADLSREVAETLVAMNELSNLSFDSSSSFPRTPGKSLMKSSLNNIKSGDNILNMVSVDSLLDLVHTED